MGEVQRAIERDILGEHERQAGFRADQHLAPLLQFICERYQVEKSDLYLLQTIPDQGELCLSIWLWPDRVVDCEIAYEESTFDIVGTEMIQTHKKTLRGHSAKGFKIIERIALSEHNQL
ncbi:hypothetical protein EJ066_06845 [Mesorhizobium sp. M9A.F.Ca.ET.002.03.1.2]|uniref:hypothetical protein n=1 Tax=Mesorhizobium sp. M9A.F.Ca.ET.002.03.1.2 TaxID=2493668 RepID=UPI000F74D815|nr:hypothetical protein [Mesorhizobium sp. M9A.F.Ca.ET.002.03.1.2]AZN97028.1 hypothetical protein EJ066_06845 [Mesorhizobium sp. M9A.F.Ca.ET.002.03.1.2]